MLSREWFSAAELAALALPGMPIHKKNILATASREAWTRPEYEGKFWRKRAGRGGGIEFHYSLLPLVAQVKITLDFSAPVEADPRATRKSDLTRTEMWSWFDRQTEAKKAKARERLDALNMVAQLYSAGVRKVMAVQQVAVARNVAASSIYAWEKSLEDISEADWLPYLAPRHTGRVVEAACSADAWEFLKADYLRAEAPNFEACYRRVRDAAKQHGWSLPSARTLQRKLADLPVELVTLTREGVEALKRSYPAQQRDRGVFHALEAVNADGHKWDVFVRWPDGEILRPMMVALQDLYSGKILSWRVDRSANKEAVRLACGDMIADWGIPDHCWLDNGRDFASKWITGGTPNRYRFKVKDEDPDGLLTLLGIKVHWTTPYHGQSKPIERAFRDFAQDVAKHPRFAGAYTGNTPMAKPENYASKAVPLDVFLATIGEEIAEHNARTGRKSAVANGRSFDTTFEESYARAPIRKATEEQRRLWLLAAEAIGVRRQDATITLEGNRYWSEFLLPFAGQKVVARFDPQALHEPLHVYRLDGGYLGAAPCIEAVGFNDVDAAREHARKIGTFQKATKALKAAEVKLTIQEVAAQMADPLAPPAAPETKVVRPITWGNTARVPMPIEHQEEDEEQPESQRRMLAALAQVSAARRGGGLRLVEEEDADA